MIYPGEFSHDGFYLECCDGKPFLMLSPNDEMDDGFSHPEHREKSVIMQFTGFKDKKGKEIYEGDILRVWNGRLGVIKSSDRICGFVIKILHSEGEFMTHESFTNSEVIGNIYENKDLLAK